MRVTTKEVEHEVDGKMCKFQIKKMDALHGSYLLKFCSEKLLPLLDNIKAVVEPVKEGDDPEKVAEERTKVVLDIIPKALASLSEEELISFEIRCLNTVSMLYPAGWQPVMSGNNFGVEELEDDLMTVLLLCYEVVEFNMGSFFGGKRLGSMLSQIGSSRPGA